MAISRLTGQDATGNAANLSCTATYPSTATANNLLIGVVASNGTLNNNTISGWTKLIDGHATNTTGDLTLFYKLSAGTETTITASNSGASHIELDIFEYTGNANPIVTDGTPGSTTGSANTSLVTAQISTTNSNDLIFVACSTQVGVSPSWVTSTVIGNNVGESLIHLFCGQNIVSSTQTNFSDTAGWTGSFTNGSLIGAFQAASTGLNINVSDSINTVEYIAVADFLPPDDEVTIQDYELLTDTTRGYSDTIASREQVTMMADEDPRVSDSINSSENTQVLIPILLVNVSDSTSASENVVVSVQTSGSLSINVTDTVNTSENIGTPTVSYFINVSDSNSLTESVTVAIQSSGTLAISVSDTITTAESVNTPTVSYQINTSDTTTASETIQRLVENNISVNDTTTLSETILRQPLSFISVSDTVNTAENIGIVRTPLFISVTDLTTLSENINVLINNYLVLVSDNLTLSENISVQILGQGSLIVSDTITTSESVTLRLIIHTSDSLETIDTQFGTSVAGSNNTDNPERITSVGGSITNGNSDSIDTITNTTGNIANAQGDEMGNM